MAPHHRHPQSPPAVPSDPPGSGLTGRRRCPAAGRARGYRSTFTRNAAATSSQQPQPDALMTVSAVLRLLPADNQMRPKARRGDQVRGPRRRADVCRPRSATPGAGVGDRPGSLSPVEPRMVGRAKSVDSYLGGVPGGPAPHSYDAGHDACGTRAWDVSRASFTYAPKRTRTSTSVTSQGPQPCASTNSATGAWVAMVARRVLPVPAGCPPLLPSTAPASLCEHMFVPLPSSTRLTEASP